MAYMIQIGTYTFKSSCCAVNSAKGGGGGEEGKESCHGI